jgi:hypothetical protein
VDQHEPGIEHIKRRTRDAVDRVDVAADEIELTLASGA